MSVALTWLVAQGIAKPAVRPRAGRRWRAPGARGRARRSRRARRCGSTPPAAGRRGAASPTSEDDTATRCSDAARRQCLSGERPASDAAIGDRAQPRPARCAFATTCSTASRCASPTCGSPGSGRTGSGAPLVQVSETLGKRNRLATEIVKRRDPAAVRDPAARRAPDLAGAGARHRAAARRCSSGSGSARAATSSPIDEQHIPEEVAPLVRAINDLLARLDESIRRAEALPRRRRAPAQDAARRPAHPGRARRPRDRGRPARPGGPAASRCGRSRCSSQSAAHMVNQLLAMARPKHRASRPSARPGR